MGASRNLLASLFLRTPVRLHSLQTMPVVGDWIHNLGHRLLPSDELIWTRVRRGPAKGMWLELNPRTGHDYASGRTEESVQIAIAKHLKPGMVFYDLGANIGFFSLLASRLVGKSGKVFSFEPDPVTAGRFRRNIERNQITNVTVIEAGVASLTDKFRFVPANSSSPDRGVGKFAVADEISPSESIQCYALDDFAQERPHPHAIKCDVEGMEVEVIRGARNLFSSRKPLIVFEIHSSANGEEVRNICRGLGYELQTVDANHLLALP